MVIWVVMALAVSNGNSGISVWFVHQLSHCHYRLPPRNLKNQRGIYVRYSLHVGAAINNNNRVPVQQTMWKSQNKGLNALSKQKDSDSNSYDYLFEACIDIKSLNQLHAHFFASGLYHHILLRTRLMRMYAIYGNMNNARLIFDEIHKPNVSTWNAMIRGYSRHGPCDQALKLYHQMQRAGIQPDKFTFPFVLKACSALLALQQGKEIHDQIGRAGLDSDVFVVNSLVTLYARCRRMESARHVFDKMSQKDVVSWNAMIAGYAQNGYASEALALFHQMQLAHMKPNSVTMVSVLQACGQLGALQQGKWVHNCTTRSGYESDVFVGNSLIDMYAKCGSVEIAREVFDKMSERNVVSWSAMITAYAQTGDAEETLKLFYQMQLEDVTPNPITIVGMLQACARLGALQQGKLIHDYIIRSGFESDVLVGNSLIAMYSKCGHANIARQQFDKMSNKDVVSWNAMIVGYTQNEQASEALTLFNQMQRACISSDDITIVSVLQACAHLGDLQQGMRIHDYLSQSGFQLDGILANSLMDMYAKCGRIKVARQLFDEMLPKTGVSWNAMISGYAQNGHANDALGLFNQMQLAGMKPTSVTMVSVLQACAHLGALQQGKCSHNYVTRCGYDSDVFVVNALIDMYAKCGSLVIARLVFDKMSKKDVISWSAMIAGYGMHGHGGDALALFFQMQQTDMKPNHVTFVSILSACSHAGLVVKGWQVFEFMVRVYCITPKMEHYACMVDLLGRAGLLSEAQDFIEKMPLEPGASVWGALLAACRIHCDIALAEHVAEHLFDTEPENDGCYVLLSNIYAAAGRWVDAANMRAMMKNRGVKKTPGCSLIEINNKVYAFLVGDKSNPQSEKIYAMLESLTGKMVEAGYVPNTNFVLHDVEDELKEHLLYSHSEKLAIVFGLINTSPGTPIRITKNLRVCGDCHSFTKFISRITRQEIIMRDANRFHHFKDGFCSCKDYW